MVGLDKGDLQGPFRFLQAADGDRVDTLRLLRDLASLDKGMDLPDETLQNRFDEAWPDLQQVLHEVALATAAPPHGVSDDDLLGIYSRSNETLQDHEAAERLRLHLDRTRERLKQALTDGVLRMVGGPYAPANGRVPEGGFIAESGGGMRPTRAQLLSVHRVAADVEPSIAFSGQHGCLLLHLSNQEGELDAVEVEATLTRDQDEAPFFRQALEAIKHETYTSIDLPDFPVEYETLAATVTWSCVTPDAECRYRRQARFRRGRPVGAGRWTEPTQIGDTEREWLNRPPPAD